MRPLFVSFLTLCTAVLGVEFVNPPPFEPNTDFALNAIYVEGSTLNIQWTPVPVANNTALTMFQLNGTQFLVPFEYLTQHMSPSTTSLSWTVRTSKNLEISNMFYLCLFVEGDSTAQANSHYFNITRNDAVTPSSSTRSSTTTTTSSTPLSSSTTAPGSTPASTTPVPVPASGELSTGAKAGIGVGISAAALLGISAGWFIFGRRKKPDPSAPTAPATPNGLYAQEKWYRKYHWSGEGAAAPEVHQLSGDESRVVPSIYELQDSHRR